MTDEAKALVERLRWGAWYYEDPFDGKAYASDDPLEAADLIETQARENAAKDAEIGRLREALEAYAARCTICSGGGSIVEEDSATGALLWRDCPGCTPARAALAGDSHD